MKKLITLTCCLILALACLAGCGAKQSSSSSSTDATLPTDEAPAEASERWAALHDAIQDKNGSVIIDQNEAGDSWSGINYDSTGKALSACWQATYSDGTSTVNPGDYGYETIYLNLAADGSVTFSYYFSLAGDDGVLLGYIGEGSIDPATFTRGTALVFTGGDSDIPAGVDAHAGQAACNALDSLSGYLADNNLGTLADFGFVAYA